MTEPYRRQFASSGAAAHYDADQYAPGSYWSVLWQLEQEVLKDVVSGLSHPISYLDFACGTGRVLSCLEPLVDSAVGLDVSASMVERARERVRSATLLVGDLSEDDSLAPGPFDLITTFRFVLNVEPEVRRRILPKLASRLRSRDSRLVLNCHGSLESYKALTLPLRWMRSRVLGRAPEHVLSERRLRAELAEAGLEIVSRSGMGVLPGVSRFIPPPLRLELERAASNVPLRTLAVDKIYVCRRATP